MHAKYFSQGHICHSSSLSQPQENNKTFDIFETELYFCGNVCHLRSKCSVCEVGCNKCGKNGHFAKVCKSSKYVSKTTGIMTSTIFQPVLASLISGHTGERLSICFIIFYIYFYNLIN